MIESVLTILPDASTPITSDQAVTGVAGSSLFSFSPPLLAIPDSIITDSLNCLAMFLRWL